MRTTNKTVTNKLQKHILSYFTKDNGWNSDNARENLAEQAKVFDHLLDTYQADVEMVQGGTFLIYHDDVKEFLNSLGINEQNKQYSDDDNSRLYTHLLAREISNLVKETIR